MLQEIPKDERLITCEDAREIVLTEHPNRLHLLASKGGGKVEQKLLHRI